MSKVKDKMKVSALRREIELTREAKIDEEKRTVEMSFSSEAVVERWFGREVLDHKSESVRLSRLNQSAALLLNHDRDAQIGVIERAWIGDDKRGHATVRFGNSEKAREIFQDVVDGIRRLVSVGYLLHRALLEETSDEGDTYRITDWEPFEVSIVSVPADVSVGIGRAGETIESECQIINQRSITMPEEKTPKIENPQPKVPEFDAEKERQRVQEREEARIREIHSVAAAFDMRDQAEKAIRENMSSEAFKDSALAKLRSAKHIDGGAATIGLSEKEKQQYSLFRALQAQMTGNWDGAAFERDCHLETQRKTGRQAQGFYVPHDVLLHAAKREVTVGGSGSNLVGTDHLASNFIELLRNRSVMPQLGAMMLTGLVGDISIPRQTGAATAGWITEGGNQALSDQVYSNLPLSPKTVSARTQLSRKLMMQSNPDIEALTLDDLVRVIALAIDLAAINGDGQSNDPTGILNTSGIGSVTAANMTWPHVVEFQTDVLTANADIGAVAYLTNPAVRGILKTRKKDDGSGLFLMDRNEVDGYPCVVSNQVPASTLIFGVFSQVIMAFWGGLDLIVNPYSEDASGAVRITAFQSCDVGIRHAGSFSAATDVS